MLYVTIFYQLDKYVCILAYIFPNDIFLLPVINVSGCYFWRKSLPWSMVSGLSFCLFQTLHCVILQDN